MKNSIILILVMSSFVFTSCKNDETKKDIHSSIHNNKTSGVINESNNIRTDSNSLIGVWNWRSDDKSQEFTIKIKKIDKDSVFGQYCAVYNNGNKIDCDVDDINNIKGLITKNKIQLKFNSFFGAKDGKAEIEIFENHIEWKIIKSPKGEYYSPESATLYKKGNKNETAQNETAQNKTDVSNKKVKLPFDFQKYMDLCYLEKNKMCDENFPFYKSDELSSITGLINSKINKNIPDRIYFIENSGLDFETYVFVIKDESEDYLLSYILMTVKDNKIISKQLIGQSIDGEAPENVNVIDKTFIINKNLSVSVFDKVYKKKNKLSIEYVINSDGTIQTK